MHQRVRLLMVRYLLPAMAAVSASAGVAGGPVADPVAAAAARLLGRMSLEHKVAQLIQPDISAITPADMRAYRFGSILNGGNSGPGGNDKAPARDWLALADAYWAASREPLANGEPAIPALWAIDAVHGHNNIPGATLFPHNIGLGAADDPALMRAIGAATAAEIAVTGQDWAFAPTLAVARDTRWGRTYESYSEDPARVARLGAPLIEGLQGMPGSADWLNDHHVIATAKHFFADGGTGGIDRGDTRGDPAAITAVHAAPYRPAIAAGVQTIMASFSRINGAPMHGNRALLTPFLRGSLGFDGVVVGDWNGHATVPGCTNGDCPAALLAGLDVFMVPEDWRALHASLVREVRDGTIPMARLDEAVGRVLRLKLRAGLFERPRPSARSLGGRWELLGAPEHRAIARRAVRESLVLLKNNGVLPLSGSARLVVAGTAADSIPRQAGGWSISWQGGGDLGNADFAGATTVFAGLDAALRGMGGSAVLSADGALAQPGDTAVVVFGETPYAEFVGDRPDHALHDDEGLDLLRRLKARGVHTVAVLLSGRPLWINREMTLADAVVAAWLPGSEGEGVADVLVGDGQRRPRADFVGRLPFHWPGDCLDSGAPLARLGDGGTYTQAPHFAVGALDCPADSAAASGEAVLFRRALGPGTVVEGRSDADGSAVQLPGFAGTTPNGAIAITRFDWHAQEDGRTVRIAAPASLLIEPAAPLAATGKALALDYALDPAAGGAFSLAAGAAPARIALPAAPDGSWQHLVVPLRCLDRAQRLAAINLHAARPATIRIGGMTVVNQPAETPCPAS